MKELIYNELAKRCEEHELIEEERFTASDIAETLDISRNTVSQHLNALVKDNQVVKINTRPVYFYTVKEVENKTCKKCLRFIFDDFESFEESYQEVEKDFEKMIGYNDSLRSVVEHCKAAITYPSGLPILIQGPTGTGKSMIATMMHEFAVNQKIVPSDKRFISVNCSEYANNPELFTSNLFGYVKGAYTGAEEDSEGLIALANGGILFLDEVHCLKAECQEKLFFFMDKKMYHRVGDNDKWYTSKCRLIFATTEDPQHALLKTLLRRIPITVSVPSLKDRPLIEKKLLIYNILKKESARLGKDIAISNVAYQTIMDYEFVGNVGGMKNAVKATCATAFLNSKNKEVLNIHIYDLPDYIFKPITTMQTKVIDQEETMISLNKLKGSMEISLPLLHLYSEILKVHEEYENHKDFNLFISKTRDQLNNYIDFVVYRNRYQQTANSDFLLKVLDKIYSIVMNKYSLNVPNNEIQVYSKIFAEYTKDNLDAKVWVSAHHNQVHELMQTIQDKAPRAYKIACDVANNTTLNLELQLDDCMIFIIVLSFLDHEKTNIGNTAGVILCHGYSTASSIADTVNRLLGQYIFDGIDMQIDFSIDKIAELTDRYLKNRNPIEELMLLVDMGSLEEIYKRIKPIVNCNIGLLNNVSTKMALEVGNYILQGISTQEIIQKIQKNYELSTHYIANRSKRNAILTVCATGFGAAQKICELLNSSLPQKLPFEIIPYDYQKLVENGRKDEVFHKYNVDLLIGTLDPKIEDIKYISVESLMMNQGMEPLEKIIAQYLGNKEVVNFQQNIMKNFTLSNIVNHLTILNAEKVIEDVEDIVSYIQAETKIDLDPTQKAGMYVHIACLIERLMLKNEIVNVQGIDTLLDENKELIAVVKEAFSGVEMRYSVVIPDAEIFYILNYLNR